MLRRAPALRHAGVVFIRKTATRARRDGGSYTSFRLVESVRSGSQVSQRTLLNLGSGFAVHPERWPELVLLVESLRSGQACLLEPDPALLGEAERIAAALVVARMVHPSSEHAALAQRERSLFDTPEAIVFYDLTNVHYHGRPAGDMQFGRSKQKRSDCPLATLALALDGAGFPRCSEVLKGNASEPSTLQAAIERLEAQRGPARSRRWSWTRACRQRRT